jgi:hypothetical protein
LQRPPATSTCIVARGATGASLALVRLAVDAGDGDEEPQAHDHNKATILHHIGLKPDQHDVLPDLVGFVAQQQRFNAMLASLVHSPTISLRALSCAPAPASASSGRPAKRPRLGSVALEPEETGELAFAPRQQHRHRRVLMCAARRDKFKKLQSTEELGEDEQDAAESATAELLSAAEQDGAAAFTERSLSLRALPPHKLELYEGGQVRLVLAVLPKGAVLCEGPESLDQATRSKVAALVDKTNSVPMALLLVLGIALHA